MSKPRHIPTVVASCDLGHSNINPAQVGPAPLGLAGPPAVLSAVALAKAEALAKAGASPDHGHPDHPAAVGPDRISWRANGRPAKAHPMPFAYNPGPTSVILLKIMAMENYSANVGRITRQRQFCSRIKGS